MKPWSTIKRGLKFLKPQIWGVGPCVGLGCAEVLESQEVAGDGWFTHSARVWTWECIRVSTCCVFGVRAPV